MADPEGDPGSPDVFQQQMVGSFCSLINGQLLLAECLAETSESIKKSVAELTTLVEESRREILDEINGLKSVIRQSTSSADVVSVPVNVQEMLNKLEAVTSKMNNFNKTRRNEISKNCANNSPIKSRSNANVSVVLNKFAQFHTKLSNGHQSASKMSQVPGAVEETDAKLSDGVIIKSEMIKIQDESSSSSSSDSSSVNEDVGRSGLRSRPGIRSSPRKFQGRWPRGRPAVMSRYPIRMSGTKKTKVINVSTTTSSSSSSDESAGNDERVKPSPAKNRRTR